MFKLLQKLFSNKEKKENETMAEEKDVKEKVETEKVETEEKAKVDEKPTEKADEKVEETKETENKEVEETKDNQEKPAEPVEEEKEVVEETEPAGNGIRVEDLVTKDYLAEKFAALEAKFDAVIKENGDLKNEISHLQDKYEDKDFGSMSRQGMIEPNKDANSSFDEYSKKFM